MAVIKAKPEKILPLVIPVMTRDSLLSQMVTRLSGDIFINAQGDTVTFRLPGDLKAKARRYEFRTRTAPIVLDDIEGGENSISIKMDQHRYSATGLTDEHYTLDDIEFARDVMVPQGRAIADDLDKDVRQAFYDMRVKRGTDFTHGDDPYLVALEIQRLFDADRTAPRQGRRWIVGSNVAVSILGHDRVTRYDVRGPQNNTAVANAQITDLAGLPVFVSYDVDPNFSMALHSTAVLLATLAPRAPRGAASVVSYSAGGYGMRFLADYDAAFLQDRAIMSTFSGIDYLYDERVAPGSIDYRFKEGTIDGYTPQSVRAVRVNYTPDPAMVDGLTGEGGTIGSSLTSPAGDTSATAPQPTA